MLYISSFLFGILKVQGIEFLYPFAPFDFSAVVTLCILTNYTVYSILYYSVKRHFPKWILQHCNTTHT